MAKLKTLTKKRALQLQLISAVLVPLLSEKIIENIIFMGFFYNVREFPLFYLEYLGGVLKLLLVFAVVILHIL